jgi:hypothetical protein
MASKITEEVAGDLSEQDKARIDAAWDRHKRAGEPDWPPRISAVGLPDGYLQRGSTGQTFEVKNGQWVRIFL